MTTTEADIQADAAAVSDERAALAEAAARLEDAAPQDILRWAVERYAPDLAIACSFGMQSVVIVDMLARADLLDQVEVFYLDTGVLFAQTHQTRLKMQAKYGFQAVRIAPELSWDEQQAQHGGHLYERGPEGVSACCYIRKVEPMKNYFAGKRFRGWVTGMRRSHSSRRNAVPVALWDEVNGLAKINPVAAFDDATLWGYIKANDVPYNPLYDQGYPSIGCNTPVCTQPVAAGEDGRSGRWSGMNKTECGIHVDGNIIKSMDGSQL